MSNLYHILNGDALKDQFPPGISGEIYVARECLVDGSVAGDSFDDLVATRMNHLCATEDERAEYISNIRSQFEQISAIPNGSSVVLWFEDDLFCQVNLWFVCSLIDGKDVESFLVRPVGSNLQYGFGGLSTAELSNAFEKRSQLSSQHVSTFSNLWSLYKDQDLGGLMSLAQHLRQTFPFVLPAVQAHCDRFGTDGKPGRPEQTIRDIISETGNNDFGHVFRQFSAQESVYGFGDVQVKALYDRVLDSMP